MDDKHVYTLVAKGNDGFTGECPREIVNKTVYATRPLAESRIERFKEEVLKREMLCEPVHVEVVEHLFITEQTCG